MHSLVRNLSASKVTHDGSQLSLASQMTMTDKDVALEEKTRPSLWRSATSLNESKVYIPNLARGDSIATAISMRRADIMVSRDDPQNLHQNETRRDEEEAVDDADKSNQDSVLFEKKKSIIILLGRLLLKCGCPCHRVVNKTKNKKKKKRKSTFTNIHQKG